jgi:16S rRNA (guanine527-N7)-methyltransferase
MLDATEKRIRFIENARRSLTSGTCAALQAGRKNTPKETRFGRSLIWPFPGGRQFAGFDRALPGLCKTGRLFSCPEGPEGRRGSIRSQNAIREMGGKLLRILPVKIYGTNYTHGIVIIEKIAPTPGKYPRPFGKISKQPL